MNRNERRFVMSTGAYFILEPFTPYFFFIQPAFPRACAGNRGDCCSVLSMPEVVRRLLGQADLEGQIAERRSTTRTEENALLPWRSRSDRRRRIERAGGVGRPAPCATPSAEAIA